MKKETVLIIGASNKPERYSYLALKMLQENQHQVALMSPNLKDIEGTPVVNNLNEVSLPIDTITLYVNPEISTKMLSEIIRIKPHRVIFNPGTENSYLEAELQKAKIQTLQACTLVLLRTKQF